MRRRDETRRRGPKGLDALLQALRSFGSSSKKRRRRPGERRHKRKAPAGAPLLTVLLLLGILYLLASLVFGGEDEPATVVVEEGDTLASVAVKLEEAGVISSPTLFKLRARIQGEATQIQPGGYQFEPGEDGDEILRKLSSGDSVSSFALIIPEGLTLSQTAQEVAEQSGIPAEEFEAAARETGYGYAFLEDPAVKTTEGFLFPKRYELEKDADASRVVDRLLQQYLVETGDLDFAGAENRTGLTEYELITVASLVEEESANLEERPLIASVIYNRLRGGMPLQIDATIQYALGKPKEELKLSDLETDSPYNTYANPGLPPGPIASPSRESIRAALEPAKTNYLYYVLEADGQEHFFTDDYYEFLEAKDGAKGSSADPPRAEQDG
ncbi:MAG: endolytic transglycosylase MltG [Actinomycetota bacterium]|nr:endolytic transglycosylase MltG [Actinomycetota bacterium]